MALLDDVKIALRLTSDAMDAEVEALIASALRDMERVGVPSELLSEDEPDPLVALSVMLYSKAHFGYDNNEADRFQASYRQTVADMLNSPSLYSEDDSDEEEDEE